MGLWVSSYKQSVEYRPLTIVSRFANSNLFPPSLDERSKRHVCHMVNDVVNKFRRVILMRKLHNGLAPSDTNKVLLIAMRVTFIRAASRLVSIHS